MGVGKSTEGPKHLVDLLVLDKREAERVERVPDLLLVERAVAVLVPACEIA